MFIAMSGYSSSHAAAVAVGSEPIASFQIGGTMEVVTTDSLNAPGAPSQFLQFSAEAIAAAPPMDPSLEALLRSVNLCEQLITAFRALEITCRKNRDRNLVASWHVAEPFLYVDLLPNRLCELGSVLRVASLLVLQLVLLALLRHGVRFLVYPQESVQRPRTIAEVAEAWDESPSPEPEEFLLQQSNGWN